MNNLCQFQNQNEIHRMKRNGEASRASSLTKSTSLILNSSQIQKIYNI